MLDIRRFRHEPEEVKRGLARRGDAAFPALVDRVRALDEELDFFAINMSVGGGERESSASMNLLSKDIDKGLDLFFDVLRKPRFEQERFDLWKKQTLQGLERRNDRTPAIESREFIRTLYGPDYFRSNFVTVNSVNAHTTDMLRDFHARVWNPSNLIIAVSGDVTAEQIRNSDKSKIRRIKIKVKVIQRLSFSVRSNLMSEYWNNKLEELTNLTT